MDKPRPESPWRFPLRPDVVEKARRLVEAGHAGRTVANARAGLRALLSACGPQHVVSACLLACVAHAPARAQPSYALASSAAERGMAAPQLAARLAAWRQMIEASRLLGDDQKLDAVNGFFNRSHLFASDREVWGSEDHWATPAEFMERGRGDCEDFAIAKYVTLRMLGFDAQRLRLMYVRADVAAGKPIAHMVVGVYDVPGAEPRILDNMIDSIRPLSLRADLSVVYSFNTRGLWLGGEQASAADPNTRLGRWRGVIERMRRERMLAWSPSLLNPQLAAAQ